LITCRIGASLGLTSISALGLFWFHRALIGEVFVG
jgi:hypothetical protein